MPFARLTITIPESVWLGEISQTYPQTRFRVIAAMSHGPTGVTQTEIVGADSESICKAIRGLESETNLTVFDRKVEMCRIQVETTGPLLLTPLYECGVPPEMPFEIRGGKMTLKVTASRRTLSALKEKFNEFDMEVTVERIQQETLTDPLLTERQQCLLDKAITRGYYNTPRQTTLSNIAEDLNMAKSTCSEILHRAEERIIKEYSTQNPATTPISRRPS